MTDKYSVHLAKDTHRQLKMLSATSNTSMKDLVDKAVRQLVAENG